MALAENTDSKENTMTNATEAQPSNTDINEATLGVGNIADKLVKHLNKMSGRDYGESWYFPALEVTGAGEYYSPKLTNRADPGDSSDIFVLEGQDGRAKIEYLAQRDAWVVTEAHKTFTNRGN